MNSSLLISRLKFSLLRTNSSLAGKLAMLLFVFFDRRHPGVSGRGRLLLDLCQPANPLQRSSNIPEIAIVIPFVRKDLEVLPNSVAAALSNSLNPVAVITLVTPRRTLVEGKMTVLDIERTVRAALEPHLSSVSVLVRHDEDVLGDELVAQISSLGLSPRYRGWCTQQLVKVLAVMQGAPTASLVLDSDTILQYPRVWLGQNAEQVLCIGQECRSVPFLHSSAFLGLSSRPRLSFVTHHQLMQRDVLKEIFPEGKASVGAWLAYANPKESDYASGLKLNDYETYGAFLAERHPGRVRFASWGNGTGTRDQIFQSAGAKPVPTWPLSISYHHYRSGTVTDPAMF